MLVILQNYLWSFYAPASTCLLADAIVSLQMVRVVNEGTDVEICVDITGVPTDGLECDVVVELTASDDG